MHRSLLAAVAACLTLPTAALTQEVTLRFQHFVSPASANPTYFMQPWADAIEEQSGGRIKVELYPFMQLGGSAASQYDLIRDGAIDGGWVIPGYEPGRFPEAEALELPFMTSKLGAEASRAAWDFTQDYLMDDFADVHVITTHMHGPGIIHLKGPAPETVDDLRGKVVRGPSRPATLLLEKLGATPVGMPVPAFPEALSRGVVDGGVITWEMSPSLKLDELTDSHTDVAGDRALYNLFFVWAMNKDVYAALPDDLKAVIDANSGKMAAEWAGGAHDTGDSEGRDLMEDGGNQIAVLSEVETDAIKALGQEVRADWIADMDARGLDGTSLVQAAEAAVAANLN
ncbi:TRAP-type C4-dicarboxylate transport system, substrate-binding protein [Loktanella sp. DSM 29012]|uniref:TRAP transporter substrate-binding protein n=1 Tax=Loktanella sp. DSM 29012 TaxID=1881056 RepID=UPI0008BCF482|nr:TRAP transporter substrate-binding protein [Loktanella sp. DSM 29012]SEQ74088.1 TRAP-type C4-dicarboxylate transport system, substrate-binding protein [Loktanella sp. DSM 29012]